MNRENKRLPEYVAGFRSRRRMHFASRSAPASGVANRALAVGTERRAAAAPDPQSLAKEPVFRGGAEDGRRGRLRSPRNIMSRVGGLSFSINIPITGPTILARVIAPINNNKNQGAVMQKNIYHLSVILVLMQSHAAEYQFVSASAPLAGRERMKVQCVGVVTTSDPAH